MSTVPREARRPCMGLDGGGSAGPSLLQLPSELLGHICSFVAVADKVQVRRLRAGGAAGMCYQMIGFVAWDSGCMCPL